MTARDPRDARFLLALAGLCLLAVIPTALGIPQRWLWYDELLSAVWSMNGPWATLMTVLRFDVHPPLYYMQLTLWMLVSQADGWLMANAALWHAAAVALLGWAAAGRFGARIGLAAALLLALSPAALGYADHVRMYSFVMALTVLAWQVQARWLEGRAGRLGWLAMVLTQAAVANSHTGGLLMLSGVVALGAATLVTERQWHRLPRWILIELAVLASAGLAIAIGMMRGVSHLDAPDLADVLAIWRFLSGGNDTAAPVAIALGLAVLAGLVIGGLRDWRLGRDALALILVPLLVAGVLSHVHRPVWIERLFVPIIPFLCLCLARAALAPALAAPRRAGQAALVALVLAWGAIAAFVQVPRPKGDGYRPAAEAVRAGARPGDTVLVETDFHYWCFLWYFAGPGWGDARAAYLMTPPWERLRARFPASDRILGLGSGQETLEIRGVRVAILDPAGPPPAVPQGQVFLLRQRGGTAAPLPDRELAGSTHHQQFVLERWVRPAP